jgi:hypothetical protein
VYPVPFKNEFVIDLHNLEGSNNLQVVDLTGRIQHQQQLLGNGQHTITMHDALEQGMYLIRISNANRTVVKKVIIN